MIFFRYNEKTIQENNNQLPEYSKQNDVCPIEENLSFEFESTITNENLLNLLKKHRKKICLLDTRPPDVFQKCKIISCDIINIPKEYLVSGYELYIL